MKSLARRLSRKFFRMHALRARLALGLSLATALSLSLPLLLVPSALAQASSTTAQEKPPAATNALSGAEDVRPRLLVLGDSISAAYGMSLEQGWVALLERRLQGEGLIERIVNASISGDTSAGGLRRLPRLLSEHEPDVLILELGGNDGLRGYPTQKLEENLRQMADLGRASGAQVLILPMEIPPNYGPRYTGAFRAAFRDAAEASGATLGPFMLDGVATQEELMQADGIHPTREAQSLIADTLQSAVEKLVQQISGRNAG